MIFCWNTLKIMYDTPMFYELWEVKLKPGERLQHLLFLISLSSFYVLYLNVAYGLSIPDYSFGVL